MFFDPSKKIFDAKEVKILFPKKYDAVKSQQKQELLEETPGRHSRQQALSSTISVEISPTVSLYHPVVEPNHVALISDHMTLLKWCH